MGFYKRSECIVNRMYGREKDVHNCTWMEACGGNNIWMKDEWSNEWKKMAKTLKWRDDNPKDTNESWLN